MDTIWFERHGAKYTGTHKLFAVDLVKGTAKYEYLDRCGRCGGAGGSDAWKFTGWKCFECGGSGIGPYRTVTLYSAERLGKLNATAAKRQATQLAKAQARQREFEAKAAAASAEFILAHKEEVDAMKNYAGRDNFLDDLVEKLGTYGSLSEAQLAAAAKVVDRLRKSDVAPDVPFGRLQVTGKVLTTKLQDGYMGHQTLKCLVATEAGYKVWGTLPKVEGDYIRKNDMIIFTATLERSEKDPKFGFYTRPTKCSIMARAEIKESEAA